jgi:hypothetical protein
MVHVFKFSLDNLNEWVCKGAIKNEEARLMKAGKQLSVPLEAKMVTM